MTLSKPAAAPADWVAAHAYHGPPVLAAARPRHGSVVGAFAHRAAAQPSAPLLTEVVSGVTGGRAVGRTVTYSEALTQVRARAAALSSLGVASGTRLGLRPLNDIDSFVTILATLWTGAAVVLANPRDADTRVAEQYQRVGAVDYRTLQEQVAARETGRPGLAGRPVPAAAADDIAVVVFTSGSTGRPRAVAQSHRGILANVAAVAAHHRLGPGTRLFACLPLFHVNALEFTGFASAIAGGRLFMADTFEPLSYLSAVSATAAHIASAVPSILSTVTERSGGAPDLSQLRYFVSAAAPLAAPTARRVHERLGKRIVQGYGLSEAANFSCLMPPDLDDAGYAQLMTEAEIPAVGPALAGNEVAVLGADGLPVPPGVTGEIVVRGPNVMIGYLGDVAATAEALRGGGCTRATWAGRWWALPSAPRSSRSPGGPSTW